MNGSTRFPLSLQTRQRNDCQGNGLGLENAGKEDPVELDFIQKLRSDFIGVDDRREHG